MRLIPGVLAAVTTIFPSLVVGKERTPTPPKATAAGKGTSQELLVTVRRRDVSVDGKVVAAVRDWNVVTGAEGEDPPPDPLKSIREVVQGAVKLLPPHTPVTVLAEAAATFAIVARISAAIHAVSAALKIRWVGEGERVGDERDPAAESRFVSVQTAPSKGPVVFSDVTVALKNDGFHIIVEGKVIGLDAEPRIGREKPLDKPTVPRDGIEYDHAGLAMLLKQVKAKKPGLLRAKLLVDSLTAHVVVLSALDAVRGPPCPGTRPCAEERFPQVTLGELSH